MLIFIPTHRSIRSARFFATGLALSIALLATPLGAPAQSTRPADTAAGALARANAAFANDRIVAPPGDNALEWTLTARELDPTSVRVRDGINDMYPLAIGAINAAIRSGRTSEAIRVIDLLERAIPGSLAARELRAKADPRGTSTAPAVRVAAATLEE